ncbi:hypothetical protein BJV78DRAFT_488356 [Lactifluus subvellereus]|nr:hypothetical protein BJV78DRAFT_488356 [Lactifluus subvellereus]
MVSVSPPSCCFRKLLPSSCFLFISGSFTMFSPFTVLATSLRLKRSSATIGTQGLSVRNSRGLRGNGMVRLKQFCVRAAGVSTRLITCPNLWQSEATSIPEMDYGPSPGALSPKPDSTRLRRLPHVEGRPSTINLAIEPLSRAEQVTVNAQPYFVPSTASASDILTNVVVQDWFAAEDARFYELSCHPTSSSTLSSVTDPWDMFDYVNPLACDDSSDSDSESIEEPVEESDQQFFEEPADESSQSTPTPSSPPKQHEALEPASLTSVHINKTIRLISSSVIEVTFRNTYPDSPPGEDDDEEAINIPITSFPHPHRLSTIIEEDEEDDSSSLETACEEEGDTSDTETIRPSSISAYHQPDARIDWTSGAGRCDSPHDSSPCLRTDCRMSI